MSGSRKKRALAGPAGSSGPLVISENRLGPLYPTKNKYLNWARLFRKSEMMAFELLFAGLRICTNVSVKLERPND